MEKYKIERKIDGGNQGSIYLSTRVDASDNKTYAVKQIACSSTQDLERVQKEIDLVLNLAHPNVVRHYESFIEERESFMDEKEYNVYIVMDYCSGGTMESVLIRVYRQNMEKNDIPNATNSLSEQLKIKWVKQIVEVLQYLKEKNIIHRDIKPDNILFYTEKPNDEKSLEVRVCDFGFTKDLAGAATTNTFVGTPVYMPPEILARGKYDYSADIWSLGVVILQLLIEVDKNHVPDIRMEITNDPNYITNLPTSGKLSANLPKNISWNPTLLKLASMCCKLDPRDRSTPEELLKVIDEHLATTATRESPNLAKDRPSSLQVSSNRKNPLAGLIGSSSRLSTQAGSSSGRQRGSSMISVKPVIRDTVTSEQKQKKFMCTIG